MIETKQSFYLKCRVLLAIIGFVILLLMSACGSNQAENETEYQTQYQVYDESGMSYEQLQTIFLTITYPTIEITEEERVEVGQSSDKKNTTFTNFEKDNRYVFMKIIDFVDVYGQKSDVVNVTYQLYNCSGFLSKGSLSDTPKSINMKRFVLESKVLNEYNSDTVSFDQNEFTDMRDANILLPFCICIVGDLDIQEYNSEQSVEPYVIDELEKAVIQATIQYENGTKEEKYLKLVTTKDSNTFTIYELKM